jgi:hypothetical protein
MDDPNITTGALDAHEDILTYTVSDEALEAAADTEKNPAATIVSIPLESSWCC